MTWADAYLGMPFADKGRTPAGCDCYGLVRLVLSQERGVSLPSYVDDYAGIEERAEISAALERGAEALPLEQVDDPREFDIVEFRRGRLVDHVGIVTSPGRMLHIEAGKTACLERYDTGKWRSRHMATYRHRDLAD